MMCHYNLNHHCSGHAVPGGSECGVRVGGQWTRRLVPRRLLDSQAPSSVNAVPVQPIRVRILKTKRVHFCVILGEADIMADEIGSATAAAQEPATSAEVAADTEERPKDTRSFEERIAALKKPNPVPQPDEEKLNQHISRLNSEIDKWDKRLV